MPFIKIIENPKIYTDKFCPENNIYVNSINKSVNLLTNNLHLEYSKVSHILLISNNRIDALKHLIELYHLNYRQIKLAAFYLR